jgi:protein disulfide-isomerase A6
MRNTFVVFCFLLAFVNISSALYGPDSQVVKLTAANFKEKVLNSNVLWFVEFYAPWCGHCKNLAPEYDKLAGALNGMVRVGAVDMTTDQSVGQPYGIQGFPTIKFFGADKNSPIDYNGQRSAKDFINFAFDNAKRVAESRLKGGSGAGSQSSSGGNAGGNAGGSCGGNAGGNAGGSCGGGGNFENNAGGNCGGGGSAGGNAGGSGGSTGGSSDSKDVIVLTDSNFDDLLIKSDDLWIVEFYAPWCGHCKHLEPEWNKAATDLKGEVKVAKIDATVEHNLASRFGVNSYPQIKLFPTGPKSDNLIEDYQGNRDASSIVSWAQEKKAQYKPVLKVEQLVDKEIFDQYCTNNRGICLIGFLPHIYDSSAQERNDYIEVLQELSKSNRVNPVTFLWSQGGDNYDVEESMALGSGYPSLVAISVNKMRYAPLTGAFDKKNIEVFVKNLLAGKQPLFNLREVPKIKSVARWDGKDSKPTQSSQYESTDL